MKIPWLAAATAAALLWLTFLASGCALMAASDKLSGTDLAGLVKQENAAGCIRGLLNGSYLGNSGTFLIISVWGQTPPAACSNLGTVLP